MSIKLVFMGRLQDAAGEAERLVPHVASIDELLSALEPSLANALRDDRVRLAVNGEIVGDAATARLGDGDEIAFLPPVSGG